MNRGTVFQTRLHMRSAKTDQPVHMYNNADESCCPSEGAFDPWLPYRVPGKGWLDYVCWCPG